MRTVLDPFRFLLVAVSGWMNHGQLQLIDYLRQENRVLREQLGERRLRFTDDQRRRLAAISPGQELRRMEVRCMLHRIKQWATPGRERVGFLRD